MGSDVSRTVPIRVEATGAGRPRADAVGIPSRVSTVTGVRLHGFHDGTLYGTRYRTLLREGPTGSFRQVGELPVPASGRDGLAYRLKTTRGWKSTLCRLVGRFPSTNVWPLGDTALLATADNYVFVSRDRGDTWTVSRTLPDSSSPMGVLPTGVCVHDGAIYLGEYPLASSATPRLLRSTDLGESWETVLELEGVRHVHAVQTDPYTGELWLTTGDSGTECRIGRVRDGNLEVVGSGSQQWRAVELAFTPDAIVWGVDSVYRERNPILRLERAEFGDGSPETLHEASSSIYYATSLTVGSERWIVVSTAMEAGTDSTGPDDQTAHSDRACVLAASSSTDFSRWHEVATYEKRRVPVDRWNPGTSVPIANAYVFLDADPDRGVVTNPYNTARDDGAVRLYPPAYFATLES